MSQMKIDEAVFDKLAEILKKHGLNEVEYQNGDMKIRLTGSRSRSDDVVQQFVPVQNVSRETFPESAPASTDWKKHPGAVTSPMVGTCYLAPEPGANNFIALGDSVQKDQPLLIIEAMKVMNLIKAPKTGKVVHIAAVNADPVEFGQLLVVIE